MMSIRYFFEKHWNILINFWLVVYIFVVVVDIVVIMYSFNLLMRFMQANISLSIYYYYE